MKRFFLVEADTSYRSLFCYELRPKEDNFLTYEREIESLFNNIDREQFFGNLNSLCVSETEMDAPRIKLAKPDLDHPVPAPSKEDGQ